MVSNLIVKAVLQVVSPALQETQSVKSLPRKVCPSAVPWILPPHTINFPPGSFDRLGAYLGSGRRGIWQESLGGNNSSCCSKESGP